MLPDSHDLRVRRPRLDRSSSAVADVSFIMGEAKKGTKSIGFIPKDGIWQAVNERRVLILERNSDRVAFVIFGRSRTSIKCYQIWVREDARMLLHGRALVHQLEEEAAAANKQRLRLWCLQDLPAMVFWKALGFTKAGQRPGGKWARCPHILWVRELPNVTPTLFATSEGDRHGFGHPTP